MTDERREELEAWQGKPLSANQERVERYLLMMTVKGGEHVLVADCWADCENQLLDSTIPPEEAQTMGWPEGATVTLHEFASHVYDVAGGNSQFSCSANDFGTPSCRRDYTSADDVAQWILYVTAYGILEGDLMTGAEARDQREAE